MKKSLFVFSILLAFGFVANFASAQLIGGGGSGTLNVRNLTGCAIWVQGSTQDMNCVTFCQSAGTNINPFTAVSIPFSCFDIDAFVATSTVLVGIRDIAANVAFKISNGCGLNISGSYVDCQGITRTATFFPPNSVLVQ
jgi:hypothetical protein